MDWGDIEEINNVYNLRLIKDKQKIHEIWKADWNYWNNWWADDGTRKVREKRGDNSSNPKVDHNNGADDVWTISFLSEGPLFELGATLAVYMLPKGSWNGYAIVNGSWDSPLQIKDYNIVQQWDWGKCSRSI